ncbi:thioredoxin fold domain-containing protein [Rhodobacterales bacterium HKCCE4037]|nr:thioredoxin fold domain-containing protein [Rhodobacterales bacterium HKCCE4037]
MKRYALAIVAGLGLLGAPAAAELDDNGLHIAPWVETTFLDLREDLGDATANGQRLVVMVEQRGCIYCTRMHEEVFVIPEIEEMLEDDFYVVRLNLHGGTEAFDFDGEAMSEAQLARRWGTLFTPTILFFPEEVPEGVQGNEAAVAVMPGAFGAETVFDMLNWVLEEGYLGDEDFQRYHARMFNARSEAGALIGSE